MLDEGNLETVTSTKMAMGTDTTPINTTSIDTTCIVANTSADRDEQDFHTSHAEANDDTMRKVLAIASILLIAVPFVVFFFTGNIAVITASTVLGTALALALTSVYGYYFHRR